MWAEPRGLAGDHGEAAGKYITSYQSQRSVLKTWHQEDEYVSRLAQDKEEMKVTLLELVLQLMGGHNEWHGRFLAVAQNPADEPAPGDPAPQEIGAADSQGGINSFWPYCSAWCVPVSFTGSWSLCH